MNEYLGIIGSLLGIAAVVTPGFIWAVRKIEKSRDASLKEYLNDISDHGKLVEIEAAVREVSTHLETHTRHEEDASSKIEEVQRDILTEIRSADKNNVKSHIALVKSLASRDPLPMTIFLFSQGVYKYIWGNQSYHEMTGLTPNECRAGLVWEIVDPAESTTFQQVTEDIGRRAESFEVTFGMVDHITKAPKGRVHVIAEMMPGYSDDRWYYLATYQVQAEPEVSVSVVAE